MPGTGWAKKAEKSLTTANGKPVRNVYVDAGSPVMANAATTRLDQDTCLTIVSTPKQADAILEVGIALPSVGGDSGGGSDVFGSQPKAQTLGNAHSSPKRSASATCSDGKGGTMDCKSSYSRREAMCRSSPLPTGRRASLPITRFLWLLQKTAPRICGIRMGAKNMLRGAISCARP